MNKHLNLYRISDWLWAHAFSCDALQAIFQVFITHICPNGDDNYNPQIECGLNLLTQHGHIEDN